MSYPPGTTFTLNTGFYWKVELDGRVKSYDSQSHVYFHDLQGGQETLRNLSDDWSTHYLKEDNFTKLYKRLK